jgi:chromosome segregation protein
VAAFAAAPTLLNLVTIPADLEKPLVAALGAAFDAGVLDGAGIQALSALTSGDGKVVAPVPELAAPGGDGIVGRALDLLPAAPDAVRGLLSRLLVVESSQIALGLLGRYEGDIVTREGVLFRANGLVAFDAVEGEAARKLENQRIQRGLEARIEELTTAVAQAGTRLEQAKSDLAEQLAALDQLNKRRVALLDERRRAQQAVDQSRQRLQQRRQDLEWNERVAAETTRTVASLKDQRDHAVRQLREQEDRQSDIDTVALSERVAALDGERRFLFGAVGRLRGEAADAEAAAAGLEGALQRSRQAAERVERQLTAKIERASEIEAEEQQRQARLMELVGIAERAERALSEAEQPIADLETRLVAIRNQLNGQATELRMLEQASLEAERALLQAENGLSRGQAAWNSLMAELQDDGFEVHTLTTTELPDDLLPETERRVKTLRQQARLAGAVDEDVVNEYESERTRIEHLQQQISDLESARDALDQVMTELQEHSEKQFAIAFDAVAREFQVYFQRFFGGGAARLVLTRPDDLGETGIEIEAQPPGKRFRSLSLLSGGERALTAAALVFAVLQINPTPFCVLDEVDAALDEANVGRFADALRDLADRTQFIVVTHNRNTIDRADGVYGLTMGGDGISKVVSIRLKRNSEEGLALEEQLARTG